MDELLESSEAAGGINFIPCVKFVRRGVAKGKPERVKLSHVELAEVIKQTKKALEDEEDEDGQTCEESVEIAQGEDKPSEEKDDEDISKEYGMDKYDEEDGPGGLLDLGDLVLHPDIREDPYYVDPDVKDSDDEEEEEDVNIRPTDNLILVGHVEGDAAVLEVYVYNDVESALYVHHDLLLPSFPLAMEWLSFDPGEDVKGNFVAVGSMSNVIDIWDIDLMDSIEPTLRLGTGKKKRKKSVEQGHTDAVLSLAWNHHVEHVLSSGSVDETVLLWDLSKGSVASKLMGHKEKVQSLQWHSFEAQTLLTGCCDNQARVFDCRTEDTCKSWKAQGEVERVIWNHFNPFTFLTSTDSGHVHMCDVRQDSGPVWTLKAHDSGVNGLALSGQCPDCLVTVSRELKVWDLANNKPECVVERPMNMGLLQCAEICPDAPFLVCVGGDKPQDNLRVWDIREAAAVRARFADRQLKNPLGGSEFGFSTLGEAEQVDLDAAQEAMEAMTTEEKAVTTNGGGAAGKFRKNEKKKKKRKNF